MNLNDVLHFFLSWRMRRPVAKQLTRLARQNQSVGTRPSYSECQDICATTRNIWEQLHTVFASHQRLDKPNDERVFGGDYLDPFRLAKKEFSSSGEVLASALDTHLLSPRHELHVRQMAFNIARRLDELDIILDERLPYETRVSKLYCKMRESQARPGFQRDPATAGTNELASA
jgi:hypothetical protein